LEPTSFHVNLARSGKQALEASCYAGFIMFRTTPHHRECTLDPFVRRHRQLDNVSSSACRVVKQEQSEAAVRANWASERAELAVIELQQLGASEPKSVTEGSHNGRSEAPVSDPREIELENIGDLRGGQVMIAQHGRFFSTPARLTSPRI
jgi:hypothetical protein